MSGSKAGGRPPLDPLARRWASWSALLGMVALMPRRRRYPRLALDVYALVRDHPVRGGPRPRTCRRSRPGWSNEYQAPGWLGQTYCCDTRCSASPGRRSGTAGLKRSSGGPVLMPGTDGLEQRILVDVTSTYDRGNRIRCLILQGLSASTNDPEWASGQGRADRLQLSACI